MKALKKLFCRRVTRRTAGRTIIAVVIGIFAMTSLASTGPIDRLDRPAKLQAAKLQKYIDEQTLLITRLRGYGWFGANAEIQPARLELDNLKRLVGSQASESTLNLSVQRYEKALQHYRQQKGVDLTNRESMAIRIASLRAPATGIGSDRSEPNLLNISPGKPGIISGSIEGESSSSLFPADLAGPGLGSGELTEIPPKKKLDSKDQEPGLTSPDSARGKLQKDGVSRPVKVPGGNFASACKAMRDRVNSGKLKSVGTTHVSQYFAPELRTYNDKHCRTMEGTCIVTGSGKEPILYNVGKNLGPAIKAKHGCVHGFGNFSTPKKTANGTLSPCLDDFFTVAVNTSRGLPSGTVLYLKKLDGIELPDGSKHPGCVIVKDVGPGVSGLDFFVGTCNEKFIHGSTCKEPGKMLHSQISGTQIYKVPGDISQQFIAERNVGWNQFVANLNRQGSSQVASLKPGRQ